MEVDGKRTSYSTLDPADFVQHRQFISFPQTDTTWTILSRITNHPKYGELSTNSFVKTVLFSVVIGATGRKSMPPGIPRRAIIKVRSLMHTITKINKDKNFDMKSILTSATREELTALNQLTLNQCSSAPTLIDYKVILHDEMPGREIYVSFILMSEAPGISLKQENFWMLPQVERDMIRQALRMALSEIHDCWVVMEQYDSKDIIWNLKEGKIYFTQFSPSATYGLTTHLPSRYLHQWHNDWFDLWDLTTKDFVDPLDRMKDPKDVPTKDADDGSEIASWDFPYPAAVKGIPVCQSEGGGIVERCVAKKAVEIGELAENKRSKGLFGIVKRGLGKVG